MSTEARADYRNSFFQKLSITWIFRFSIVLFMLALLFGLTAALVFVIPETLQKYLPFQKLRPLHVSSAVFWILTAASAAVVYFTRSGNMLKIRPYLFGIFVALWMVTIVLILLSFVAGKFGGREYWEYPPLLSVPLLTGWLFLVAHFFLGLKKIRPLPVYLWMWATGIIFFALTFVESNLWLIPWFRNNIIRDISVQWKSNGSLVGSWNMLVYGIGIYLMEKMSGDPRVSRRPLAFFLYFLGLFNLLFNWGHHIYALPAANWIRDFSYVVSMTEWLVLLNIIRQWNKSLSQARKHLNRLAFLFLMASDFWILLNLFLALLMSIPVINLFTHGTHVTVAHAMGTTIGINSMILLAALVFIAGRHSASVLENGKKFIIAGYWLANVSLFIFWTSLVIAGIIKGYLTVAGGVADFNRIMTAVLPWLQLFAASGISVAIGLGMVLYILLKARYHDISGNFRPAHKVMTAQHKIEVQEANVLQG